MNIASNIWKLYLIRVSKWFMVFMPIIVLFYQSNGLNLREVMSINAIYSVTAALFEVPSGYFSDRFGRKKSILLGTLLITLQFFIISNAYSLSIFCMAAIVGGMGSSFISGSDAALLYDSLHSLGKKEAYIKWEGRSYALGTFSEAVAAILGGTLAYSFQLRTPVYVQVFVSMIGVIAALLLVEPPQEKKHQRSNWAQINHILKYVWIENKSLRFYLLVTALFGLASLLLAWFAQPFLDFKGVDENMIGYLWAAFNLTVAFFSFNAHKIQSYVKPNFLAAIILLSFSFGYIVIGMNTALSIALLAMFVMYASRGIAAPVFLNIINQYTPSEMRATVLSLRGLLVRLSYAIVAPFLGWMADLYTINTAFLLEGLFLLVLSLVAIIIQSIGVEGVKK